MEATVAAIEPGRLAGTAAVPPSKSAAHRAVVCAALAAGTSHIGNVEFSQDILATLGAAQQLGAKVERSEHELTITGRGNADGFATITRPVLQKFGVKVSVRARKDGSATYKVAAPQHYAAADMDVEGDYSQAAFLAVLGSTVGGITITGLPSGSHQGDRVILDILKQCGAKFERSGSHVTFHRSLLKAVEIDLADCPDLGPVLIALGCFCSGTTIIRNAGRLRIKECDRIAAMQEELAKMGGTVKADGDTLTIEGCALHKPTAPLNGHNDHRIVMAMAVAALAAGQPAVIEGANAVNKSWPDFFEVIKGLGAHVTNQG